MSKSLASREYYYFRAANQLSRQMDKSLDLSLIASVMFWHFDLFNRTPLRAMIHLHATTRLWRHLQRGVACSTTLIADVETLMCSLAGIASPFSGTERAISQAHSAGTKREYLQRFTSLETARASLSRCMWAVALAYDPATTAGKQLEPAVLERIVFEEDLTGLLDFSDPPFCALSDCATLLTSWQHKVKCTTEAMIPFDQRQTLLLHARLIRCVIQKNMNNCDEDASYSREKHNEDVFSHVLDAVANMAEKLERHHHLQPNDGSVPTSLRPLLLFILRCTRLHATIAKATKLMQQVVHLEKGVDTVLLMWMGFISEEPRTSGEHFSRGSEENGAKTVSQPPGRKLTFEELNGG